MSYFFIIIIVWHIVGLVTLHVTDLEDASNFRFGIAIAVCMPLMGVCMLAFFIFMQFIDILSKLLAKYILKEKGDEFNRQN